MQKAMKQALAGLALLSGGALLSPVATASAIDFALSNETANFSVVLNPRQFYTGGGSELAFGGFVSEEDDRLAHVSLMARGTRPTAASRYNLAAGLKAIVGEIAIDPERVVVGDEDSEKVGAVALGFQTEVLLSQSRRNPVELGFDVFFAPSIASFSDAEQFSEIAARLQIEIIPQARAYVGYRRMGFDTNDYDKVRLDRSVHVGLRIVY